MTETTRAYIAGLFDGEGSCFAYWHGNKYDVRLAIGMTDKDIIQSVHFDLGFGKIRLEKRKPPRKTVYRLSFATNREKRSFIDVIKPYIRLKRLQLELAIEMINHAQYDRRRLNLTSQEVRTRCAQQITRLNSRGSAA